jgi:hypothetical protein
MENQLTGVVHYIGATEQKTDNFSVRSLILKIDADSQYPQFIPMQASNAKASLLDGLSAGSTVTVSFNLKGQLGKQDATKAYANFDIWKITKI